MGATGQDDAESKAPVESAVVVPRRGAITLEAVRESLVPFNDRYGPTIDVEEAAALGGYAVATVYKLVSEGHFARSVSRRRPLRFLRDLYVWERMTIGAARQARRRGRAGRRPRGEKPAKPGSPKAGRTDPTPEGEGK